MVVVRLGRSRVNASPNSSSNSSSNFVRVARGWRYGHFARLYAHGHNGCCLRPIPPPNRGTLGRVNLPINRNNIHKTMSSVDFTVVPTFHVVDWSRTTFNDVISSTTNVGQSNTAEIITRRTTSNAGVPSHWNPPRLPSNRPTSSSRFWSYPTVGVAHYDPESSRIRVSTYEEPAHAVATKITPDFEFHSCFFEPIGLPFASYFHMLSVSF